MFRSIFSTTLFFFSFGYFQSTTIAQSAQELSWEALDSLSLLYEENGEYELAVLYSKEIVARAEKEATIDYVEALGNLSYLYENMGIYEEAKPLLIKALKVVKKIKGAKSADHALYLGYLAGLYEVMGHYKDAEQLYLQAIEIEKIELGEDDANYAITLSNLAMLYVSIRRFEDAEPLFLTARKIIIPVLGKDSEEYASVINNLASLYKGISRFEEAEPLYLEALEIHRIIYGNDHPEFAMSINNLAVLYEYMHRFNEAISLLLQALEIYKDTYGEEHPKYAVVLNNLANIYVQKEMYSEAKLLQEQAITITKKTLGKQNPKLASYYLNLSYVYQCIGGLEEAEKLIKKAIEIEVYNRTYENIEQNSALQGLAFFYQQTGRYQEAEKTYLDISNMDQNWQGNSGWSNVINSNNLADVYVHLEQFDKGLLLLSKAFSDNCKQDVTPQNIMEKLPALSTQATFLYPLSAINNFKILARLYDAQFRTSNDFKTLKLKFQVLQSFSIYLQRLQLSLTKNEDKLMALKQAGEASEKAIRCCIQLYQRSKNKDYLEKAITFAEYNKSAILSSALNSGQALNFGEVPDSLIRQEKELNQLLTELEKKMIQAKDNQDSIRLQKKIVHANIQQDAFTKQLKELYPKYNHLKQTVNEVQTKTIQEELLDDQTAFMEYFVFNDTLIYLILITKNSCHLYDIHFEKNELNKQVKILRNSLSNYPYLLKYPKKAFENYTANAYALYRKLFEPIRDDLGAIRHLILVADGLLGHIPFEVLIDQKVPQSKKIDYQKLSYLIKEFNFSYSYAASLLLENKKQIRGENNGRFLAFGATYDSIVPTILETRSFVQQKLRKEMGPLESVSNEIKALKEIFPTGTFHFDLKANEAQFKSEAQDYAILHLAMHGLLNKQHPLLSSLAFTENGDSLQDNFLEAHEISALNLHADLVVLSACETGFGKFQQGEGILSLARSFMYAGVPSMVVSLWQVNDGSTAIVMDLFYNNLAEGLPKDEALRQAKLAYIDRATEIAAHPAFWSPFIQIGDNSPIQLQTERNVFSWLMLALLVASIGGLAGLFYRRRSN